MPRKKRRFEDVKIIDIGDKGMSIGRKNDGEIILVEKSVPGDVVDVQCVRKKKGIWITTPIQYHISSPWRKDPFCAHFEACGGCKWQHLDYQEQIRFKENAVENAMLRIGKFTNPTILPVKGADRTTHYRNKLEFSFSNQRWLSRTEIEHGGAKDRSFALGFHPAGFYDKIVDIKQCYLMDEPANQIRNQLRDFAIIQQLGAYDYRVHQGFLRTLLVRKSAFTKDLMVVVVFGKSDQDQIRKVMVFLKNTFPEITSLQYVINTKTNDSLQDQEFIVYSGNNTILENIGGIQYQIGAKSFFQTNSFQAVEMFEVIRDWVAPSGNEIVYDLYCGAGSIGLYLATLVHSIVGIEIVPEAIKEAEQNRQINEIQNAFFYDGDVKLLMNKALIDKHGKPDLIIVDPPRAGLHQDVCKFLNEIKVPRLIYVSCNPSTQARDLNLISQTYRPIKHQPIDMFPHTHHIENITLLHLQP